MYMSRYLNVSHQTSSDLSLVTIFLHFALKRGPFRAQDDFLTFTIISNIDNSDSQTFKRCWSDETDGDSNNYIVGIH